VSVQAISWVLEHSRAEHGERLVLISLANHAGGEGGRAWPSISTIARESRLGESTVRGALNRLLTLGEIVEIGKGPRGTRCFRLATATPPDSGPLQILDPPRIEREGAQNLASRGAESAAEPSVTVPEPSLMPISGGDEEWAVYAAWAVATGRDQGRTKLTPDRRRTIQRALKSHGLEDCIRAVKNIGRDSWAGGENDRGRRFDDIKHALGDAERIERWRDHEPGSARADGMSLAERVAASERRIERQIAEANR